MSNGQDTLQFDAQGFTEPMAHPSNPEYLIVYHKDDDKSHAVKLDPGTQKWVIVRGEREGTVEGGGKRDAAPKRAIDEEMGAGEAIKGFGQSIAHGFTMGWADELLGLMSPEMAAKWEANRKQFRQQHKLASGLGELAGGVGAFIGGGAALGGARAVLAGRGALAAGRAGAGAAGRAGARQAARGAARTTPRVSAAAPVARAAPTVAPAAVQAPRGLIKKSLIGAAEGAGFGAAYGAGEAEGGLEDRLDKAYGGGLIGAGLGAAIPIGIAGLAGAGGKVAQMAGGTVDKFKRGIDEDRLLGGASPESARAMAREEAAGGGGLLGGGIVGAVTRLPRRVIDALRGKGGVTLSPERQSARTMINTIDKAKSPDWRDLVSGWRREAPDTFANMTDDEVWLRKLADHLEETGAVRPGQLLATLEPQLGADVASAARQTGGYQQVTQGLLPAAEESARKLTTQMTDAVEDWTARQMRRLGGEAAEGATTSGRRLSSRHEARSAEASRLYGELESRGLSRTAKDEISAAFRREGAFRNESTKRELQEAWVDLVESQNRGVPPNQRIALDVDGGVMALEDALEGRVINSAGRAEMLTRIVREIAKKYAPSNLTGTANALKHKNLMGMADELYKTLNRVTGGDVADVMAAYRRQSEGMRAFVLGDELVRKPGQLTIQMLDDTVQEVRRNAVRGVGEEVKDVVRMEMQDEAEDALIEGYVTALADKARRAAIDGSSATPEQVFLEAEPFLKRLFGNKTDELLDMLRPRAAERETLQRVSRARPTAPGVDPGTEAAEVLKGGTFAGAGQTQAMLRSAVELGRRAFGPGEAQRLATVRLGQLPVREGLDRLATMRRYDLLRQQGQQRLGDQAAVAGGLFGAGNIRRREPRAPTYSEVTRGLLQNYNR